MKLLNSSDKARTPKTTARTKTDVLTGASADTVQTIFEYANQSALDVLANFESSDQGLKSSDAEIRLEVYGANIIESGVKNTALTRLKGALFNPFTIILLAIVIISYLTDVILTSEPDYTTVLIIAAMLILSTTISYVQSTKSNKAAASLRKMITNKADVIRENLPKVVEIDAIVPGDIIKLSAGDMLPADVRFLSAKDLFIGQAVLTGESGPVEKFAKSRLNLADASEIALTDLDSIGFMGSNVISGTATGVVLLTGNNSYLGNMSKLLNVDKVKNSFDRGVDSISKLLIRFMVAMVPVVLLVNGFTKGDWWDSVMFAIAIAVGLTPEMLPVIMTSTLARGAITLSRHKVIVKELSAIQAFGEMDILCTDKTGTLTEDKIVLERYMNVTGEDDERILNYAFLNSSFQTGLKNLLDLAIINRANENGLGDFGQDYTRIDEIPFDFTRRRMSVILEEKSGERQLITKGAVEEMLSISKFIEIEGESHLLDESTRDLAMKTYLHHNNEGLRMIAVAKKNDVPEEGKFSVRDESDLTLIGFVGFLDPPKESAAGAIAELREHGVRTIVLTGDSEGVAANVCAQVGVGSEIVLVGGEVDAMSDADLAVKLGECDIYAKLSPSAKERIVRILQSDGHTVGFMGDGINDAPALNRADVGISVDTAVDIAKETAQIILLQKDLRVLSQGVVSGRETFCNIIKYLKMAVSGNFGNMISVLVASVALPFLPMLPVQILTQNLLTDFSQIGMPFDKVDGEYIMKPKKWEVTSIKSFMVTMGLVSSVFDILMFLALWYIIGANSIELSPLFQCGWFVFGTLSQIIVIYTCRTSKLPFIESRPSIPLLISTLTVGAIASVIGFSWLASFLDMTPVGSGYVYILISLLLLYFIVASIAKRIYISKKGQWI